jgi:hypothetical protein
VFGVFWLFGVFGWFVDCFDGVKLYKNSLPISNHGAKLQFCGDGAYFFGEESTKNSKKGKKGTLLASAGMENNLYENN